MWHESMSRSLFRDSETLQERRMLEYVVLGDYQTAVAFLLASSPERSARYYRDAMCTVALAAAASGGFFSGERRVVILHPLDCSQLMSAVVRRSCESWLAIPGGCL